jgi:hypothetical protein
MISRREFIKRVGGMAMLAAGGGSLTLLEGLGGRRHGRAAAADAADFLDKETLEAIRAKIDAHGYRFTVDRNWCYDEVGYPGTPDETIPDKPAPSAFVPYSDLLLGGNQTLPSSFDIRNVDGHSYIGPIRDQAATNMCWDFGLTDASSAAHNYKNGLFDDNCVELSTMYLTWALRGGSGSGLDSAYKLTKRGCPYTNSPTGLEGSCRETDFPFASFIDNVGGVRPPSFVINRAVRAPRITMKRCAMIRPADYRDTTAQIKAAIYRYGAVKASVRQSPAAFKAYASGVYEDMFTEPDRDPYYLSGTGHDLSLVGWDDYPPEGGGGCWILRNEWGPSWGEGGYMRIRYFSALINTNTAFVEARLPGDADFLIRGMVTVNGVKGSSTTVTLSGDDNFAMGTDVGLYPFQGLNPGRYTVTPIQTGVAFTPASREVVVTNGDIVTGMDFQGTRS